MVAALVVPLRMKPASSNGRLRKPTLAKLQVLSEKGASFTLALMRKASALGMRAPLPSLMLRRIWPPTISLTSLTMTSTGKFTNVAPLGTDLVFWVVPVSSSLSPHWKKSKLLV